HLGPEVAWPRVLMEEDWLTGVSAPVRHAGGAGRGTEDQEADRGRDRRRTFDYAKWFPESAKRELFALTHEAAAAPTFAALAREWLENKKAWFAPATYYDRKRIIEGKLIPFFADRSEERRVGKECRTAWYQER